MIRSFPLLVAAVLLFGALFVPSGSMADEGGTVRYAVLVGNNKGVPPHRPLRYAEDDAMRVRRALLQVGGFTESNILLLVGQGREELLEAFDAIAASVAAAGSDRRTMLLFYFSGHSDGASLELGDDPVSFMEVQERIAGSGTSVRLAVVDTCLSGRLIGLKGVTRVPAFNIDVQGDAATSGTVVLTSSTAGEVAQESSEIGGAFYTHHLVSGLYGAADQDGDLRVTLREAYRYAYRYTVGDTVQSLAGTQHPAYSIKLEGWGDLVLSMITGKAAVLTFPAGASGDYFVLSEPSGEMVAELPHEGRRDARLFVAPGKYLVARKVRGDLEGVTIDLKEGEQHLVEPTEFVGIRRRLADVRGGGGNRNGVFAYYGLSGWVMPNMGAVHSGGLLYRHKFKRLDLQARLSFGATSVNDAGFTYDLSILEGALMPLYRFELPKVDLLIGLLVGTSRLGQESSELGTEVAWTFDAGVVAGLAVELFAAAVLLVSWEFDIHVFSMDGDYQIRYAPKGVLGLGYEF